jgi:H+-translocating NAD(P) transhydrogenase subunit alpha
MSQTMVNLYIFVLSCFVGYHVIWGVTPALHTPLMAVTNAISGIVIVGAILVAGAQDNSAAIFFNITTMQLIGFVAIFLASINIFGGFVVTNRILAMFKKRK